MTNSVYDSLPQEVPFSAAYSEVDSYHWLGRKVGVTDSAGKEIVYRYDAAELKKGKLSVDLVAMVNR